MSQRKYLSLLMVPTDYCNMKCKYCFFDKISKPENKMSIETLEYLMKITLPFYGNVSFIWHGGEPLSMGLNFYKKVIELQEYYRKKCDVKVSNNIQTNITLLTEEMAEFFVKNSFTIGSSYDGIFNQKTRGQSENILNGVGIYKNAGGRCGMISVVSNITVNTLIESYNYFKSQKLNYKLNPYLGTDEELMLDYDRYTQAMIELFNYWAFDTDTPVNISSFGVYIDYILLHRKHLCTFTSCLGKWASVNYNGTIKPCNRYFPDEYSYGNIFDYNSFDEAFNSEGFRRLITKAIDRREKCKSCDLWEFCSGGCNYIALNECNGVENNGGNHCQFSLTMYKHIENFLEDNKDNKKLNKFIRAKFEMRNQ